jgi:uncharacterized protein YdhG (YjbR/CyaY superfamily)
MADAKKAKSEPGETSDGERDVIAYLERAPEPARTMLGKMREIIRAAAPKSATEGLSYRMPAFFFKGALLSYAAFKDHCSLFPMGSSAIEELAAELKGYRVTKGTIHFPLDKPLPKALIAKIVKACVARNEARPSKKG